MPDLILSPALLATTPVAAPSGAASGGQAAVFDITQFNNLMQPDSIDRTSASSLSNKVTAVPPTENQSTGFDNVLNMLKSLNGSSNRIETEALKVSSPNADLTPGEMLKITVKAHEFLFQSEMTANVANRSSDGIQQLFKQQS
ncbi:MAG: hypothetical protein KUG82_21975 [Pseudomonadales bacterium]|nr:hypothetical protein [Pseudomonadales bacterium]